jgi:phosphotriesterase-related protein
VDKRTLKGNVQTVTGLIAPHEVGPALMHEHLIIDLNPPGERRGFWAMEASEDEIDICNCFKIRQGQIYNRLNFRLDEKPIAIRELQEMRVAGGRTVVELTVGGLKPDPIALAEIAQASGANIVMGCGHYVHEYQAPQNAARTVDDFAQEIVGQIMDGAWGTSIRAGIIGEIGCQSPWTAQEKRVMQGAILAQLESGAALNVHPGRHADQPLEVVDFVRAAGGRVDRLILSHIDRTIFDAERLLRLADSGCVIEFDLFGWESGYFPLPDVAMPNDDARLRWIRLLIQHGHLDRVLISHDICTRTRLTRYGGHGYQHIFANVLPLMRRRGFSEAEIEAIVVTNPARLLTFV